MLTVCLTKIFVLMHFLFTFISEKNMDKEHNRMKKQFSGSQLCIFILLVMYNICHKKEQVREMWLHTCNFKFATTYFAKQHTLYLSVQGQSFNLNAHKGRDTPS